MRNGERRRLHVRAYAKINLGLEVLGRRPDGLHEVKTILQTIDLADDLTLEESQGVSLRCSGMKVRPDNLILQAAYLLREKAGVGEGCAIRCTKRIPVGAGLGGGSTDAAATICALAHLWSLHLDPDTLSDLAATLGADVPFFLRRGTALATGAGSALQALPSALRHWVVLVPMSSSEPEKTSAMYHQLRLADLSDGSLIERQVEAIRRGALDYESVQSAFTRAARAGWSESAKALDLLDESGALATCLSGAGPSVFGLFRTRGAGLEAMQRLRSTGVAPQLRRFLDPPPLLTSVPGRL